MFISTISNLTYREEDAWDFMKFTVSMLIKLTPIKLPLFLHGFEQEKGMKLSRVLAVERKKVRYFLGNW